MSDPIGTIVFRADASVEMGTGHVMRCMTLADALSVKGGSCHFLTRAHEGHLIDLIQKRGHSVIPLRKPTKAWRSQGDIAHARWLGVSMEDDALECLAALELHADWIVVDHYALDARWEQAMAHRSRRTMVIDDIADRLHACDILLDQNFLAAPATRYNGLVAPECIGLYGPQYALVRPEFAALRAASLDRKKSGRLERLLVFMSGGDASNETAKVVEGVRLSVWAKRAVDIVVGINFPFLDELERSVRLMPAATIHIQSPHMAELMAVADCAVTAGGSVTWEKCVLGLPSYVAVMGENQRKVATHMHAAGAQITMGVAEDLAPSDYARWLDIASPEKLQRMMTAAIEICGGSGTKRVIAEMEALS